MSATVFYTGTSEVATLTNVFYVGTTPTDPSTVTCVVTDPVGFQTSYTVTAGQIVRTAAGTYTLPVVCPVAGLWAYLWTGTGIAADESAGTWTVFPSAVGNQYCSMEELKSRLGINDSNDDFEIALAVQAAAADVEDFCGRYFWKAPGTRTYVPESLYSVQVDDLVSIDPGGLQTDPDGDGTYQTIWSTADYQLSVGPGNYNPAARGETWPYTEIHAVRGAVWFPYTWMWSRQDRIKVTGIWGWPSVPPLVRHATLMTAVDVFKQKDIPWGIAGFDQFGAVRVGPPIQVRRFLRRYVRGQSKVGV